jgi:hypothetical protein
MGKKPTIPALLDWLGRRSRPPRLAAQSHRGSFSNQAAYQSTNFQPRRLAAEELRDSLLAVRSGELNLEHRRPRRLPADQ